MQVAAAAQSTATSAAAQATTLTGSTGDPNNPLAFTGGGTTNFIPLWTSSSNLGSSVLFQSGSGSTGKIGLNTTAPASTLDVNGSGTVRGILTLPATGTATTTAGKNSQPASLQASAFNSSTSAAVNQTFNLQAEPATTPPAPRASSTCCLLPAAAHRPRPAFRSRAKARSRLSPVRHSPGTGTITGVTTASGSGLTGGGTTGSLSIGLQKTCATNQVLQWNGSSWLCASVGTGTISGVTAGVDLTGGGATGNVTLNLDTTKVPQLAGSNTFTTNQSFSVNGNTAKIGDMGCGAGYIGLSLFFGQGGFVPRMYVEWRTLSSKTFRSQSARRYRSPGITPATTILATGLLSGTRFSFKATPISL